MGDLAADFIEDFKLFFSVSFSFQFCMSGIFGLTMGKSLWAEKILFDQRPRGLNALATLEREKLHHIGISSFLELRTAQTPQPTPTPQHPPH